MYCICCEHYGELTVNGTVRGYCEDCKTVIDTALKGTSNCSQFKLNSIIEVGATVDLVALMYSGLYTVTDIELPVIRFRDGYQNCFWLYVGDITFIELID